MLKIGHRGARAYEPENTLRSFRRALELGVNAVELDVRSTKDGRLVVIHDAELERTTGLKGSVGEFTLDEIKAIVTKEGEKMPTLEEAMNFLDDKVKILIELKEEGLERDVLTVVHEKGLTKNVIIISFLEEALKRTREIDEHIETGLIYVRHKDPLKTALQLKANYLLPLYRFAHSADMVKAHENGLKVIVWTINDAKDALEYAERGVDGITSDRPDILRKL